MARKKRPFSTFNLSFLDIMSCGFGAVVLVFLIIDHQVKDAVDSDSANLLQQVALLQKDVEDAQKTNDTLNKALPALQQTWQAAQKKRKELAAALAQLKAKSASEKHKQSDAAARIAQLKSELLALEQQVSALRKTAAAQGENVRDFSGDGRRQYLTGLTLNGKRVVILLDSSASMLSDKLVNIIRLRNMAPGKQRAAQKWQRALQTAHWLLAQLPEQSQFQLYTFNTSAASVLQQQNGTWLKANNRSSHDAISKELESLTPSGGTSLINAFSAIARLSPQPDTLFLITDGLPTQGKSKPRGNTVSPQTRLKLFRNARKALPAGIAVNVILAPMEGDPMAAAAFWGLAQTTHGAFISPAKDWP